MLPHNARYIRFVIVLVAVEKQRDYRGDGARDLDDAAAEEEPG